MVWTGRGAIVPLTVIALLAVSFLSLAIAGLAGRYAWAAILATGLLSGPAIFLQAQRADRSGAETGTFFFLPTRLWAFIVPAMMTLMALGSLPDTVRY